MNSTYRCEEENSGTREEKMFVEAALDQEDKTKDVVGSTVATRRTPATAACNIQAMSAGVVWPRDPARNFAEDYPSRKLARTGFRR